LGLIIIDLIIFNLLFENLRFITVLFNNINNISLIKKKNPGFLKSPIFLYNNIKYYKIIDLLLFVIRGGFEYFIINIYIFWFYIIINLSIANQLYFKQLLLKYFIIKKNINFFLIFKYIYIFKLKKLIFIWIIKYLKIYFNNFWYSRSFFYFILFI